MRKRQKHPLHIITLKHCNYFSFPELAEFLKVTRKCLSYWVAMKWEKRWKIDDFPRPEQIKGLNKYIPAFRVTDIYTYLNLELPRFQNDIYFIEPLLTIKEVSQLIERNERTVKRYIYEDKELPVLYIGNRQLVRIQNRDLKEFSLKRGYMGIYKKNTESINNRPL